MVTLTADPALEAVLGKQYEVAETRVAAGKLLGYFTLGDQEDALSKPPLTLVRGSHLVRGTIANYADFGKGNFNALGCRKGRS